jgi:hypothetical protein
MNTVTTATVSLGAVTIGLGILAWHLTKWWRGGGKDPKALLSLLNSMALGMIAITASGGLIGTAATFLLDTSSLIGNWSLTGLTGTATPEVTRSGLKALTPGGSALLVIYVVILIALWKSGANKVFRGKVVSGVVAGVLLGLSAGFSGIASMALVTVTNTIGDKITGVVL